MTDNEIIKALQRMSEEDPDGFSSDVLDLVNRQKAEIERLKAENEGYKHLDTILHTAIDKFTACIKSEAIREFANRLKYGVIITSGRITCEDIDNLVKGMTEENENNG